MSIESLRFGIFIGALVLLMLLEAAFARRPAQRQRWLQNISYTIMNGLLARFVVPVSAVAAATWAGSQSIGLLNYINLPTAAAWGITIIALDFAIYWQHRAFHKVPLLWRIHQLHHTDQAIDATTALRFHPIEIGLSILIKAAAIIALGAPALAVVAFEITLNASAMFNHANIRLPLRLDAWLRKFLVTPDMHRVHHSVIPCETNANYGFCLPWWDRLFGSYRAQPQEGHTQMRIGLKEYQDSQGLTFYQGLVLPFEQNRPK